MFERKPDLDVVFVPWDGVDPDQAVRIGATWLSQQPGAKLVLLHAKKMYTNNRALPALTRGAVVERPSGVWRSGWSGGPVLAPWPSEEVLASLSDQLSTRVSSVCVIEWGDFAYQSAWLEAHGAVNLVTGEQLGASTDSLISPVVRVAMERLSATVNHNNSLIQGYEKAYAVRTLQELHRSGHTFNVESLCAWALANGFTQSEVKNLRTYATRVIDGRSFQLRESVGPKRGDARRWEEKAREDPPEL